MAIKNRNNRFQDEPASYVCEDTQNKIGACGESEKVEASRAKILGSKPVACNGFQPRAIPADLT